MDIIEEAFGVANGLHHSNNENNNSDGEGVALFDHEGQQPLGEMSLEDGAEQHSFNPVALEDAMKELYTNAKSTKLLATILLMNFVQYMELTTNLQMSYLHSYTFIYYLNPIIW
jgi:hypothetical protein